MTVRWQSSLFLLFISYRALDCCVIPDSKPSWSLSAVSPTSSLSSRKTREVTLSERSSCGDSNGDQPLETMVDTNQRVADLIEAMKKENLAAYIVPSSDEHLSEYVSDYDKRRAFLTGFRGSAGTAVVLADGRRALWTDGRYFLEADLQLDCHWLLMKEGIEGVPTIPEWLKTSLASEDNPVVGADPKLISFVEWIDYDKQLKESNITFKPVTQNLVDLIWPSAERTPISDTPIEVLELNFAGKKWEDKVADLRSEIKKHDATMFVITAMDEIAWLFNLRGGDVPFNPVFQSYALIDSERIRLFLNKEISPAVDLHLKVNQCEDVCVEIHNYKTTTKTLSALSSLDSVKKVLLPSKYSYSGGASYAIYASIPEEKRLSIVSPILMMKARKNEIESKGMRNAHVRDAVALIDFLSLLEEEIPAGKVWDEISAAKRLEEFRAEQEHYRSLSFATISSFGTNGAIIHYRPTLTTNKRITNQSLYLLDSGGQYKDGTTDVTRTLHYGKPTKFQKEAYTRVLKGAIDVAAAVFPKGTKDTRIDILARRSLYEVGLDYKHGTGHGIGMFLNIHESPVQMRIYGTEENDLIEGYFFSDEPGYYKAGDFGVRLETIVTVVQRPTKYSDVSMLGLEPVTLVPFEPKLIDISLLDRKQCKYLNEYNARIREVIGPELDKQARSRAKAYMMDRTEPLDCSGAGTEDATGALQREQIVQKNVARSEQSTSPESINHGAGKTPLSFFTIVLAVLCSFLLQR